MASSTRTGLDSTSPPFGACDAPDPYDERRRPREVNGVELARVLVPARLPLDVQVIRESTRKTEDIHHNVLTDMIAEHASLIAHRDRMIDQLGIVIAGRRSRLSALDPLQLVRGLQGLQWYHTIRALRVSQRFLGLFIGGWGDDRVFG